MKNKIILLVSLIILFIISFFIWSDYKLKESIFLHTENDLYLRVDKIRDIKNKKTHIGMPDSVRAIYMSSWTASSKKSRSKIINFVKESRINAIVLDIKDYSGLISFKIDEGLIGDYKTSGNRISDIDDLIEELHDNNIYIIGRITVFQDPLLARSKPEFAFKRKDNGEVWKDKKGLAFINPKIEEAWNYYLEIAELSYQKGFDEINFDYIRYPSDGNISNIDYALDTKTKREVMESFYVFLDRNLRSQSIPISADLFGFTASQEEIFGIGQHMGDALKYFDIIAPMVYPSHYPKSYLGFTNAAAHPYEVVRHEMELARKKAVSLGLNKSSLRTWIQDFNLGAVYGVKEIQDQIKASYISGVPSYMVWDPSNRYTKNAYYEDFLKKYEE